MNHLNRYFHDLYLGVWTTLVGMSITAKHVFMPTITVQYPHQKLNYPPRARAALVNTVEICNGCVQCARACPVNIIDVKTVKALPEEDLGEFPDGKKRRLHIVDFYVDMSRCVYCGFCVDACPTEAIHWEAPHSPPVFDRRLLMRDWSKMTPDDRQRLIKREAEMKAAKAAEGAHAAPKAAVAAPAAKPKTAASAAEGKPAADSKPEPTAETKPEKEEPPSSKENA